LPFGILKGILNYIPPSYITKKSSRIKFFCAHCRLTLKATCEDEHVIPSLLMTCLFVNMDQLRDQHEESLKEPQLGKPSRKRARSGTVEPVDIDFSFMEGCRMQKNCHRSCRVQLPGL